MALTMLEGATLRTTPALVICSRLSVVEVLAGRPVAVRGPVVVLPGVGKPRGPGGRRGRVGGRVGGGGGGCRKGGSCEGPGCSVAWSGKAAGAGSKTSHVEGVA